jgi:hypothetical protein
LDKKNYKPQRESVGKEVIIYKNVKIERNKNESKQFDRMNSYFLVFPNKFDEK